ncbi:dCTP deaminase [Oceanobacillus oncorhynchi subsp. incaldanensis]|uniref:dCTP deaminase n=1 Tax=Oceanobacillus TaxID=182709 RepID=UPI001868D48B|nr:dCTP deaminase [Oceanobacillus oncorhynchi]MDM8100765.1 dCTP deaminase [Oceanobacillus oncorhynchi]UUI41377.1 dCTP deaminase [Oceanobacillus oncorhynchi]GIO17423.1 dCTP deaminase [Oceanobacillus oncorhynchi subsp. incaldanensis]
MILSGQTIKQYVDDKQLTITPFQELSVQPASIDLRLGKDFLVVDDLSTPYLSVDQPADYRKIKIAEQEIITIPPQSFLLGTTLEQIGLPEQLTAFVEGRSSIGRLGVFIQNAGWIDPGFSGQITLELFNANRVPVQLQAGMRVCQLVIAKVDQKTEGYSGKYLYQQGTTPSRVYLDKERT